MKQTIADLKKDSDLSMEQLKETNDIAERLKRMEERSWGAISRRHGRGGRAWRKGRSGGPSRAGRARRTAAARCSVNNAPSWLLSCPSSSLGLSRSSLVPSLVLSRKTIAKDES